MRSIDREGLGKSGFSPRPPSEIDLEGDCRLDDLQKYLVDETGIEPATFPVGTGTLSRAPVALN